MPNKFLIHSITITSRTMTTKNNESNFIGQTNQVCFFMGHPHGSKMYPVSGQNSQPYEVNIIGGLREYYGELREFPDESSNFALLYGRVYGTLRNCCAQNYKDLTPSFPSDRFNDYTRYLVFFISGIIFWESDPGKCSFIHMRERQADKEVLNEGMCYTMMEGESI